MFICQVRLLVGRFPAGEELNEADEAKVERSGLFVGDEVGLGDALRVARRAVKLCLEWPCGFSSLLTWRHFLAMIRDLAFILHTLLVL